MSVLVRVPDSFLGTASTPNGPKAYQSNKAGSLCDPLPGECRNINLLSIDYAFRPRLRHRLTLGGFTFPRKPWAYGDKDSHLVSRYSSPHMHFYALQEGLRLPFDARRTLAYHAFASAVSAPDLFPIIIGAELLAR